MTYCQTLDGFVKKIALTSKDSEIENLTSEDATASDTLDSFIDEARGLIEHNIRGRDPDMNKKVLIASLQVLSKAVYAEEARSVAVNLLLEYIGSKEIKAAYEDFNNSWGE